MAAVPLASGHEGGHDGHDVDPAPGGGRHHRDPARACAPGGIGLGLWGLVGLAVLVFGFGLPPGDPPTSSMFIILTVITAASTMQSVGGIDYLVEVAKKLLKRKPAYIALIAPIVAFVFTLGAGTGFIYYPLIPVIFAVAYANKRPARAPAGSGGHGVAVRHHRQPGQRGDGDDWSACSIRSASGSATS